MPERIESLATFIATLVLMNKLTLKEADALEDGLKGKIVPKKWTAVIEQIEEVLGRELL